MNNLAAAPALAPGDLLLYSPLMPHRTQRMLSGSRIGLSGSLYEPSLLIPWVAEVKSLELLTEPPDMGLVCWDKNTKEWHGNLNWQSAGTHGISNGTTACFPQVYPQPQENEMVTRFSNDLLNPYGPHSVKLRRFLHSFPLQKLIGAAPGWLLPWFT